MSELKKYIEDFKLLEAARFDANHTLMAQTTIAALYFLQDLCKKKSVSIDMITASDIIAEITPHNQKTKEHKDALTK